ncbi:MAG: hypothetical protein DMG05_21370 [Acidobacteria bacterium]|nr:MAG: hypothetical protein DMG05_21370 [Acidobacteriota bacterium]
MNPHYRMQSPLDEVIRKTEAGSDAFVTEKYAEEIEVMLGGWSTALRSPSRDFQVIAKCMAPLIEACRLRPAKEQCLRSEADLQVWRGTVFQPIDARARVPPPGNELFPG